MNNTLHTKALIKELINEIKTKSYSRIMGAIHIIAALLLTLWFPFNKEYLTLFISLWVLTWLLEFNYLSKFKTVFKEHKRTRIYLLPIFFFLYIGFGYFYSLNKEASSFDLEVKASLLLFPIIFISTNELYAKYFKLFLLVFVLSNLIAVFVDLGFAINNSLRVIDGERVFNASTHPEFDTHSFINLIRERRSFFSYVYLSKYHHPAYFALYLNVAIVMAYYLKRFTQKRLSKTLYFVAISVFIITIILLSSRAGLLTLVATLLALLINEFLNAKNQAIVILITFSVIFGFFSITKNSRLGETLQEVIELKTNPDKEHHDARLIIWDAGLNAIKSNFWFGVGNGDVKDVLVEEYAKKDFEAGVQSKFNVHNQYLETQLAGGIFATILMAAMLLLPFIYIYKKKKFVYGYFLVIIISNFMFESMLNVLAGVTFFAFIYGLLVKMDLPPLVLEDTKEVENSK